MSISRNTAWNILGSAGPLVVALVAIPTLLNELGGESFGVLTLLWTLIGYLSLFDFGIGRALTYEVSRAGTLGSPQVVGSIVISGLLVTLLAGIFGAAVVFGFASTLAEKLVPMAGSLRESATFAFQAAAAGVVVSTIGSGARGALEGMSRFDISNISKLVTGMATFGMPVFSVWRHGPSLEFIAIYLVAARVVVAAFLILAISSRVTIRKSKVTRSSVSAVLNYGSWVSVTGLVGPLMVYGDRFFVGAVMGSGLLPYYAVPQEALQRLLIIPAAVCGALMPLFSAGNLSGVDSLYRRYQALIAVLMGLICIIAGLAARPGIEVWISRDFADRAAPIAVVLLIGIWINSMASLPYTRLHAMGAPKTTALIHCIELPVYFGALWWAAERYGLMGAAWTWTARAAVDWIMMEAALRAARSKNDN